MSLYPALLETLEMLSLDQQELILDFARSLQATDAPSAQPSIPRLSLSQIAKLPINDRNTILAPYILDTARDFLNDPELTEFADLDLDNWANVVTIDYFPL
jgi:hypothetical protein